MDGCLEMKEALGRSRRAGRIAKGQEETFGSDGYVLHLDCDSDFTVDTGQRALRYTQFVVHQLYLG